MKYILDNPSKLPNQLKEMWDDLDEDKQKAYKGLANLKQNIHWVVGEAGTGKSHLMLSIILMVL